MQLDSQQQPGEGKQTGGDSRDQHEWLGIDEADNNRDRNGCEGNGLEPATHDHQRFRSTHSSDGICRGDSRISR